MFYYNANILRKPRNEKDIISHNVVLNDLRKTGLDSFLKPIVNFASENDFIFAFCIIKCKKSLVEEEIKVIVKKIYPESQLISFADTPKAILGVLVEQGDVIFVKPETKEIIFKSCDAFKLK